MRKWGFGGFLREAIHNCGVFVDHGGHKGEDLGVLLWARNDEEIRGDGLNDDGRGEESAKAGCGMIYN
jgi:hypothetical protein